MHRRGAPTSASAKGSGSSGLGNRQKILRSGLRRTAEQQAALFKFSKSLRVCLISVADHTRTPGRPVHEAYKFGSERGCTLRSCSRGHRLQDARRMDAQFGCSVRMHSSDAQFAVAREASQLGWQVLLLPALKRSQHTGAQSRLARCSLLGRALAVLYGPYSDPAQTERHTNCWRCYEFVINSSYPVFRFGAVCKVRN